MTKCPLEIQNFECICREDYAYVDRKLKKYHGAFSMKILC